MFRLYKSTIYWVVCLQLLMINRNVNISDLISNTCYLFGVRSYTINGYGLWTEIGTQVLVQLVPSYIPVEYPIITYEIEYTNHQSNGSCSSDKFSPMIKSNTSSRNVTISDLIGNTC